MSLECSISSTGFINYFPSSERTKEAIAQAYRDCGKDIAIIDGEDNWYASRIFHIGYLLQRFNIKKLADFHTGISGISKSGAVIAKKDLPKFIREFNKHKWEIYNETRSTSFGDVSIYDDETKSWKLFFRLRLRTNTVTDLYKRKITREEVHNSVSNFKNKKRTFVHVFSW